MKYEKPIIIIKEEVVDDIICTSPQGTTYEGDGPDLF